MQVAVFVPIFVHQKCTPSSRSPRKSHHEDDEDDEAKESDGEAEIEVLKTEAASKVSIVNLEPVDKTENKVNLLK